MAARVDLARLREQTMGSGNEEEAVTVNTRALIDKVLARYSGDWTTLRELIQNAADALATRVVIKFETLPSRDVPVPSSADPSVRLKHVLMHHTLLRLTVSNNGQAFADTDWSRLKRIAEGNPDETKIGAFGVGFYSVFADCEEPFVISGNKTMAFYWKGNSLFTRTGKVENPSAETSFMLEYRNTTSPVPDLESICQFLSTSLTFVGLQNIELWLDDWNIVTLTKKSAPSANVSLPKDVKLRTRDQLMKVVGVVHQGTQIDAKWMNVIAWSRKKTVTTHDYEDDTPAIPTLRSFFSKFGGALGTGVSSSKEAARKAAKEAEAAQQAIAEDVSGTSQATVFLRISTVNIQTYVNSSFAKEIERATKKPPPKHTRIAILTSSHDDVAASVGTASGLTAQKSSDLFASVLPTKNGRVFIGFPTAQTTGMLCHISAPSIIPTVERESIDLNARWVRTWNVEMLRVAGIACRIAYAGEMQELRERLNKKLAASGAIKFTDADIASVIPLATHIFKQYTAQESTPSAQVGKIIEEAFWECTESGSIEVLSTKGVLPSHQVRVVSTPLSFLGETPIIPQDLVKDARNFVQQLYELGLVTDMSVADIRKELEARSLDEKQLLEFLKWAGGELSTGGLDRVTINNLLNSAVAMITEDPTAISDSSALASGQGKILVLAEVKSFLNEKKIPPDMLVPSSTIPFKFTQSLPRAQLEAFGWEELQIVPWVRYLIETASSSRQPEEQSITASPALAKRVLPLISKQWDSISQSSRATLTELLSTRTVMPTKLGMKRPPESYFSTVKLFDDLPTIDGPLGKDKFLVALGVRKTVELNVVFDRLMSVKNQGAAAEAKWSFSDLVHYLVTVSADIPSKDIERLKTTAICPVENSKGDGAKSRLYKITDVYVPTNDMRMLKLPVLQWSGQWRESSPEARFLSSLGIKPHPTVEQLITIMLNAALSRDQTLYDFAMQYFISRHHVNGYSKFDTAKIRDKPFLPVLGHQFPELIAPGACFVNEKAAILGYNILDPIISAHALKFGVITEPPIVDCVNRVISNPPRSHGDAAHIFGYMAGRVADISPGLAEALGKSDIVPITKRGDSRTVRMSAPQLCFLGDQHDYDEFLDFVNFGFEANAFLMKVGSKHEPTSIELAKVVIQNPSRILGTLQQEKYLDLLRKLAENQQRLKSDKTLWRELKDARWLLTYRDVPQTDSKRASKDPEKTEGEDLLLDDDENVTRVYALARPPDIVIQDNYKFYQIFRDYLSIAPQEDLLEGFYAALGTPTLDSIVDVTERMGMPLKDQTEAQKLLRLIVQRSRVFLFEYNKEKCLHDAKWLEKSLSCTIVQSISTHLSLRTMNASFSYKRTAALSKDGRKPNTLFITAGRDLYEVSSAIVRLLLKRPKRNDAMALETILVSRLQQLRERGYNVERILQQEAYRSRIAEEERKRQQAEEQKRIKEQRDAKPLPPPQYDGHQDDEKKRIGAAGTKGDDPPGYDSDAENRRISSSPDRPMPGGWDSPDQNAKNRFPKFFSNLQKQIEGFRGNSPTGGTNSVSGPSGTNTPKHVTAGPQSVTSQRNIHNNLVSAVQACRSHNSDTVFSQPSTTTVEEQRTGSYCDETPGQNIVLFGDSAAGIKIYVARSLSTDAKEYVTKHRSSIDTFGFLLLDLGSIFGIPPQTLHIFIDERGQTIAFNQSGALFCNYHFFAQLHEKTFGSSTEGRVDALSYWWVVLSHELAHNLVKEHGAQHSFYAESFCQQYFGKVMSKALQYRV